ncbi:DinB family protein [Bacillus carboniphilus]|uniref:DinB family protein n=1 Tax=Bacillus carboniphilus TaxID=86663 RepID=A0ABY9JUB5_9BACI|nr:DinB family protein [Bacillus carboniphilus]WLR42073.1 DinB family protein [Bacillus carboniphilus]
MFQRIDVFLKTWGYESKMTQKLMSNLTDESLKQPDRSDHYCLGQIADHLANTIPMLATKAGLSLKLPDEVIHSQSVKTLLEHYQRNSEAFIHAVEKQWKDDDLNEELDFFGATFTKGMLLTFLIQHQAHHRGQMTVLMREAGLMVPGMYGPSKEERAALQQ